MRRKLTTGTIASILISIGGCTPQGDLPLIFGQSHTVGLTAAGSTTNQEVELTLGYKDKNLAIVPTDEKAEEVGKNIDALSTLGTFSLDSGAQATAASVGLGKFFATGMAARVLSEGFRCSVSSGQHQSCTAH